MLKEKHAKSSYKFIQTHATGKSINPSVVPSINPSVKQSIHPSITRELAIWLDTAAIANPLAHALGGCTNGNEACCGAWGCCGAEECNVREAPAGRANASATNPSEGAIYLFPFEHYPVWRCRLLARSPYNYGWCCVFAAIIRYDTFFSFYPQYLTDVYDR